MPRHTFCRVAKHRLPVVGDLIRNSGITPEFINIVLEVSPKIEVAAFYGEFVWVRSVRYGATNGGNFKLLDGRRSRGVKYFLKDPCNRGWEVVEEFVVADNEALRDTIVKSLEGIDTTWHESEES